MSAASAFEIATKVRLGKLTVPSALLNDFAYVVEADGFRLLDIDAAAAMRAGQLSRDTTRSCAPCANKIRERVGRSWAIERVA